MKSKLKSNKKQTINRLAKILGCKRQVVANHIKRGDAPALDDVPGWTAHLAAFGRIGSQVDGDLRKQIAGERLLILKETRIKLERDNDLAAGKMIDFGEARRQAAAAASAFFAEWDLMCMEMPPVLKGCDEVTIFKKLSERREQTRQNLNDHFDAIAAAEKKQ